MRKLPSLLLAVCLAPVVVAQAPIPASERAGFATLKAETLKADLGYIASDKLQGRMSLQPGDDLAVHWIEKQFRAAGLEPAAITAAGKASYLQTFELIEYRPNRAETALVLETKDEAGTASRTEFHAPVAFGAYKEEMDLTAAVAFAGYGITAPLPLQAIADDELHIPVMVVQDAVAEQLFSTLGTTGSALQSAIDKDLRPQSRVLAETTVTMHFANTNARRGTTSNVVGLLRGSDPALAAETILITAHHDHDGEAPCGEDQGGIDETGHDTPSGAECVQTWHGADDNGSGTVGVVALARAFAANGVRPKRSILFTVFASEERGLLGAYWMAAHPLRPLETTRAQINFDMIGRDEKASKQTDGLIEIPKDTTNRLNLIGALYSPSYDRVVKEENKRVGLTLDDRFDHESALNVFFRSDQFPFVLKNIPAFWWFTGFHPDYHHITDTAEKIDYAKMTKILHLAYLSAWRFGEDAQTPVFVANPKPQ